MSDTKENPLPRRSRLDLNTPAELAIFNAMQEVEKAGADVRLTEAIILLDKAKNAVADFVDGISQSPIIKTINPIGYLKNGEYFSFGQMLSETNDSSDKIIPLYDVALTDEPTATLAEGLPDAETVQQKVRDIIDGNTGDNDISIWKNIIEWYQGIASQLLAKKDEDNDKTILKLKQLQKHHYDTTQILNEKIELIQEALAQQKASAGKEQTKIISWVNDNFISNNKIEPHTRWENCETGNIYLTSQLPQLFLQQTNKSLKTKTP